MSRIAPECGCVTPGKIVRGMCVIHYDRWVHRTPRSERGPAPRAARDFWSFVDKASSPDGCWLWTGPTNRKGYGLWSNRGTRGLAHRISLAEVEAPQTGDLFACHRCDNPPCVNPKHLYWGTAKDNALDVVSRQGVHNKGAYATHCKRGHEMAGANLRIVGKERRRFCRACDNARSAERQRRYREMRRGA